MRLGLDLDTLFFRIEAADIETLPTTPCALLAASFNLDVSENFFMVTDCKTCPYPFKTNHEGQDSCPAVQFDLVYAEEVIWGGSFGLVLAMLGYACHFDITIMYRVLTFSEYVVARNYVATLKYYYYYTTSNYTEVG